METNFFEIFVKELINNRYFLAVVTYVAGIFSSIIIFRKNDRYKRINDLREGITPSLNFLDESKTFSGNKINLDELKKTRDLLSGEAKTNFDKLKNLILEYNSMPRHDSQKNADALRSFHADKIIPAVNQTVIDLEKI